MADLGSVVREHRGSPWKHAVPALIAGALTFAGIWAISVMHPPEPGKASLVVLLFAAITVLFIILTIRDTRARLFLHDRGLVYERGGAIKVVRYADVTTVTEQRFNGKPSQLILQLRTGAQVQIPAALEGYEHAAQTIANAV